MKITIHTVSGAPRGWRVLLGLAFKGLDFETRYLEASKQEHKSPEFLKLNPRGTVPVLVDTGTVIRDSIASLAWLDRAYPEKPLFGHTPGEGAIIWQTTMECSDYLRAAANDLLFPILVENKPLPAHGSDDLVTLENAAEAMHAELKFLEGLLENQFFLAGEKPTAADAIAFPEVRLVGRAIDTKTEIMEALGFSDMGSRYPRIKAWKARTGALPGVEKTMPRHW